jgi:hypothetical protein
MEPAVPAVPEPDVPGIPAIDWLPPDVAPAAARSAALFALWASNHIDAAKTARIATRTPRIVATIAESACESDSSCGMSPSEWVRVRG